MRSCSPCGADERSSRFDRAASSTRPSGTNARSISLKRAQEHTDAPVAPERQQKPGKAGRKSARTDAIIRWDPRLHGRARLRAQKREALTQVDLVDEFARKCRFLRLHQVGISQAEPETLRP